MCNLIMILILSFAGAHRQNSGEIKITFNSTREDRSYAKLNDTVYIEFIPANKNAASKYVIHNTTISFSAISNTKEPIKQDPVTIPDEAPSKKPVVKIPLKDHIKSLDYDIKFFVNIERVTTIKGETVEVPRSQRNKEYSCVK